tara:strand:+ start:242 stop:616 length:375 start_codon:yes stop_codon:yes gene_type:complete
MKAFLFSIMLASVFGLSAQIKKKDFGRYIGTIESYKINSGQELLTVKACPISVNINKENLLLNIGSKEFKAVYRMKKIERRSYMIFIDVPYSDLEESFRLNGKDKIMLRKGIFPQPDCELKKQL